MAYLSDDPDRVGGLIETAHALLAGLDPSDEMAFALHHKKLWSVHLNDQNGLKFDEEQEFRSSQPSPGIQSGPRARRGGFTGGTASSSVSTSRPSARRKQSNNTAHLANSKRFFELMVKKVRSFNRKKEAQFIKDRDYEGLERLVIEHLLGR